MKTDGLRVINECKLSGWTKEKEAVQRVKQVLGHTAAGGYMISSSPNIEKKTPSFKGKHLQYDIYIEEGHCSIHSLVHMAVK